MNIAELLEISENEYIELFTKFEKFIEKMFNKYSMVDLVKNPKILQKDEEFIKLTKEVANDKNKYYKFLVASTFTMHQVMFKFSPITFAYSFIMRKLLECYTDNPKDAVEEYYNRWKKVTENEMKYLNMSEEETIVYNIIHIVMCLGLAFKTLDEISLHKNKLKNNIYVYRNDTTKNIN